jgi:CelD/BcsL family acetyltransferase involved in cellulose biosynthesis
MLDRTPAVASPDARGVRAQIVPAAQLATLLPAWEKLCSRAVEDNVYYTPPYALALLRTVARATPVRVALAWDRDELVGLLPLVTRPGLVGRAWRSAYTFGCTPLLDRDRALPAADLLLGALREAGPRDWIVPRLRVDGPAMRALDAALEARGAPRLIRRRFERAVLETGQSFDEHMRGRVGNSRRRDLERNRRRLAERGALRHACVQAGPDRDDAVAAFLAIEASGWKGRRGTALACRPETAAFAREAFGSGSGDGFCRVDLLLLDERPVAASLTVFAGRTGFTVKTAFDESLRRSSPGLLLEVDVLRSFLEERWADRLDAATDGAHVVDALWDGSTTVGDLVFSLATFGADARTRALAAGLDRLDRAKDRARSLVAAIRERLPGSAGDGR